MIKKNASSQRGDERDTVTAAGKRYGECNAISQMEILSLRLESDIDSYIDDPMFVLTLSLNGNAN